MSKDVIRVPYIFFDTCIQKMADENQPSVPFFTFETPHKTSATQTSINYFSDVDSLNPPTEFDLPPEFNGSGPTLLHQYYANTKYFIDHIDPSTLSPYKQEIFTKVKQRSIFQSKIFDSPNLPDGSLPPNTFENLSVSLYLIIFPDHFTFSTAIPGIEINGDLNDDISRVLSYISQGLLPPRLLDSLKDMNLTWYDGGLICEISDQRKAYSHPLRVLMRVNPIDITNCGFDIEQEFLLNRFPLLCLDPDIRVSKLTREVIADSQRWQPSQTSGQKPADFLQSEYPSIFIEPLEPKKARTREESKHTEAELRKMLMIKLGILKEENTQEKELVNTQLREQDQPTTQQQLTNDYEREQVQSYNLKSSNAQENAINSDINSNPPSSSFHLAASLPPSSENLNLTPSTTPKINTNTANSVSNSNINPTSQPAFSINSKADISQQIVKLMQQQKIAQFMDSAMSNTNVNKNPKLISASNQSANTDDKTAPQHQPYSSYTNQDQSNE